MNGQNASPTSLRYYVAAVIAAGAIVLLRAAIEAVAAPHPLEWLLLGALAVVTGSFKLNIASVSAIISVSDTFFITTALLFGPGPAAVVVALDGAIMSLRRRHRASRIAFNALAPAMALWAGAQTFFRIAGVQPLAIVRAPIAPLVLPLLALAVVYFGLNSGLIAVAIGLESRQSPAGVWREHLLWLVVGYLASASLAFCLILVVWEANLVAAVVVLPMLAILHLTLRATFGRLDDAHRHLADVDRLYLSTVQTLAMAIDAKDDVTHSHVQRVQAYATGLARVLGISDVPTLKAIEAAALLHDTGKLAVPEHILNKPGKLTAAEFEKMKRHVDIGADILSLVQFPYPVVPIVRCHHESWDGTGYPRGLKSEEIPIGARILSVVDCFDALTSDRPYRRRMSDENALAILRERSGRMYDPRIVETFIAVYRDIPVAAAGAPEQREVLERLSALRRDADAPLPAASAPPGASNDRLAFASLARMASGDAGTSDALSLASTLVSDTVPGVTGAWFLPDENRDRLVVAGAFGPSASAVAGLTVGTGERLTGWVAASRQAIVNADAALDLGVEGPAGAAGLQRCMSVALVFGGTLVGVLSLYSPQAGGFSDDRVQVIQAAAPDLAAAIHAARLNGAAGRRAEPAEPAGLAKHGLKLVAVR